MIKRYFTIVVMLITTEIILLSVGNGWLYCFSKIITSGSCLLLALSVYKKNSSIALSKHLTKAIAFCFLGDLFLGINSVTKVDIYFYLGMLAFEIALIIFIVSMKERIYWFNFLISILGLGIVVGLHRFCKSIDLSNMLIPCVIYAFTLFTMFGRSVTLYFCHKHEKWTLWLLCGSTLFVLSDAVLLITLFHVPSLPFSEVINHMLYFPAIMLFIQGIYEYGKKFV